MRTPPRDIYTLSLHDALPIWSRCRNSLPRARSAQRTSARPRSIHGPRPDTAVPLIDLGRADVLRSEEHTSELQSRLHLVCRLLLEKKKKKAKTTTATIQIAIN